MTSNYLQKAFVQKEFVNFEDAKISIATQALHYGTAAFGGLRGVINPDKIDQVLLFRLPDHAKRLSQSAKFLGYDIAPDYVQSKILEFVKLNKPTSDFYIRPLVYVSSLGLAPKLHNCEYDFLIYGLEMGDYFGQDIRVCFGSWVRQNDASFPLRGKISAAYITSALAKTEAVARGFDEAILMNSQGKVCEGTGMNIFIVRDDRIITPSVDQDILEGITRRSLITIAEKLGYTVEQRPLDKSELLIADEVFLCGTAAKVTSVKQVENFALPANNPITKELQMEFSRLTLGQNSEYENLINRIDI